MRNKPKIYDERCYDLAVHFIGTEKKDEMCADLASAIQEAVEDWFNRPCGVLGCDLKPGHEGPHDTTRSYLSLSE